MDIELATCAGSRLFENINPLVGDAVVAHVGEWAARARGCVISCDVEQSATKLLLGLVPVLAVAPAVGLLGTHWCQAKSAAEGTFPFLVHEMYTVER